MKSTPATTSNPFYEAWMKDSEYSAQSWHDLGYRWFLHRDPNTGEVSYGSLGENAVHPIKCAPFEFKPLVSSRHVALALEVEKIFRLDALYWPEFRNEIPVLDRICRFTWDYFHWYGDRYQTCIVDALPVGEYTGEFAVEFIAFVVVQRGTPQVYGPEYFSTSYYLRALNQRTEPWPTPDNYPVGEIDLQFVDILYTLDGGLDTNGKPKGYPRVAPTRISEAPQYLQQTISQALSGYIGRPTTATTLDAVRQTISAVLGGGEVHAVLDESDPSKILISYSAINPLTFGRIG